MNRFASGVRCDECHRWDAEVAVRFRPGDPEQRLCGECYRDLKGDREPYSYHELTEAGPT